MEHSSPPPSPSRCSTGNTLTPPDPSTETRDADQAAAALDAGLAELGVALDPVARQRLLDLSVHLAEWAPRINLTAHRTPVAIVERLILDAVALERVLPDAATIADMGSGAGFPGLPLAILRPASAIVLVEAREKRHHFQRAAIRRSALGNVRAVCGRFEDLEPIASELVVAQAVASPDRAVPLVLRWAASGGWIAIPGGREARDASPHPEILETRQLRYRVPGGPERTLWMGLRG